MTENADGAPSQSWLNRPDDEALHITQAGRVAVPLTLHHRDAPPVGIPLVMSAEAAMTLCRDIEDLLGRGTNSPAAADVAAD